MKNPLKALVSGSPGARKLAWSIFIAVIVSALALSSAGKWIVEAYEGMTSADTMTRMSAFLSGADERSTPVTLIAIDDETRAKWRNPVITPHPALAELISIAREKQALAILLDIDLSSDAPDQELDAPDQGPELNQEPDVLNQEQGQLRDRIEEFRTDDGLLMLVRPIRFKGEEGSHGSPQYTANLVRRTPYDAVVIKSAEVEKPVNPVWVSAVPALTADRVLRKIKLWQTVCSGGEGTTYASPVLHVEAATLDNPASRRGELDDFLIKQAKTDCAKEAAPALPWLKRRSPDIAVEFVIGADAGDAVGETTRWRGKSVPLFHEVAAWTLLKTPLDKADVDSIDPAPFKDRIVIIGVTHADSRDVYATPLGPQPGVMVLANAVAAGHAMVDTPELSWHGESTIAVILFLIFAVVGSRVHLVIATFAVGLFSAILLTIMAPRIGFDPAIRIIGLALTLFALHHVINSLIRIAIAWRGGLGWRAILVGNTGH